MQNQNDSKHFQALFRQKYQEMIKLEDAYSTFQQNGHQVGFIKNINRATFRIYLHEYEANLKSFLKEPIFKLQDLQDQSNDAEKEALDEIKLVSK